MRETRTIEFKETITNTFLKTVSAFSNYDGGEIFFGVDDDNIKGLTDIKQACLDIENKINEIVTFSKNCNSRREIHDKSSNDLPRYSGFTRL